ncbi:MAG TPA: alpha/beta hydrolase [Vicinamibacterales bacterium]|nr:alpha/beta hydrolase [Vicinamibacterales bacterium]
MLPGLPGLRFAHAHVGTGPRLHYAEQGDADGKAVVFLHGWPDSWFSFSRVLPLLSPRFHAFVLDQRGFGDSERPDAGYRVDDFAADAVAFLDAVALPRAIFVGHSFGSLVARRIAIAYPERVARLVLIGTGVTRGNPVLQEAGATMRGLEDPIPVEFAREFQASTAYAAIPEAFFERIVAESMKLPSRLWRAIFDEIVAYDDAAEVERINAPTLLIWGEHDALFPRADQDRLVAAIRGARLKVYAATGHCPNWEFPERVAAEIEEFLEKS